MDFLKKHYEKVSLAAVLIVLIASAILLSLKANTLNSELGEGPDRVSTNDLVPQLDVQSYSNAILSLKQPPLWTNAPSDLFAEVAAVDVTNVITSTNGFQVILMSVTRKPFKLLFKAYSYDAQKSDGYNFQVNFQFRSRTFFVRAAGDGVKDHYEDTGYKVAKFEKKSVAINDPSLGGKRDKDVSELTLQHEGERPVVLVILQETEEQEPVAKVRCGAAGVDREYRRGQSIGCNGRTYKVVDINLNQMIIVDIQTQEQQVIKPQQ
jgi:hypothetical protein